MPSVKPKPVHRWSHPYCLVAVLCAVTACIGYLVDRSGYLYFIIGAVVFAGADGVIPTQAIWRSILHWFGIRGQRNTDGSDESQRIT